jgi:hypothetical protein
VNGFCCHHQILDSSVAAAGLAATLSALNLAQGLVGVKLFVPPMMARCVARGVAEVLLEELLRCEARRAAGHGLVLRGVAKVLLEVLLRCC